MKAYLPLENYIEKKETKYGVGLLVSLSEDKVKSQTSRIKNVTSYNQWLSTDIPDENCFLNLQKTLKEQISLLEGLKKPDFMQVLFITELTKIFNSDIKNREMFDLTVKEFTDEKYQELIKLTGFELIQFVNERCRNHDMAKSSALLYTANIKGSFIPNGSETDFLVFNPHNDLTNVVPNKAILEKSNFII